MRYALIIAGGSGTRLWPMSRAALPKQLIPFVGGRSLLEIALERLDGLVPPERCLICAGEAHAEAIRRALPQIGPEQFLGEPCGRDTLNAVGLGAAVLARRDPEAIDRRLHRRSRHRAGEPVPGDRRRGLRPGRATSRGVGHFRHRARRARRPATDTWNWASRWEKRGQSPTDLRSVPAGTARRCFAQWRLSPFLARRLRQFREKPDLETARAYFEAGPEKFLWNSGMFVWRADTLLDCIRRYAPQNHAGLTRIADAWDTPEAAGRSGRGLPDAEEDQRRLRGDGAGLARSGGGRWWRFPCRLRGCDVGSWPSLRRDLPSRRAGQLAGGRAGTADGHPRDAGGLQRPLAPDCRPSAATI